MSSRRGTAAALASLLAMLGASTPAAARELAVPSFDGTPIVTRFYPATTLEREARAPTVLMGPVYAVRGETDPDRAGSGRLAAGDLRRDGFNVLTWDPRGFGRSGGTSTFGSAAFEARDVQALLDFVAAQPEALLDAPGDPRAGMLGASYSGAIQYVAAAIDPRIDAIAPDIAWSSLATSFAKDGAVKAGWLLQICASGAGFGLLDGIPGGPAGVQLGSIDSRFATVCAEGNALGRLSAASIRWLHGRGPGALVDRVRAPALITQGTVDTLFPPGEAIANYRALRANGVPAKMLWYCGGHGTCPTPAGVSQRLPRAQLAWLRRWLKRDASVDTGPGFEWVDDGGVWRSARGYPLPGAGSLPAAAGSGTLAVTPSVAVSGGSAVVATPSIGALESRYAPPGATADIVGEPTVTLTYRGFAVPSDTFVYAQVLDAAAGRVAGNQVTPIPVVLDGRTRTVTRTLEVVALRGRPTSDLRLQLLPTAALYGPQRSAGTVTVTSMTSALPLVDPAPSWRAIRPARWAPGDARDRRARRAVPRASRAKR